MAKKIVFTGGGTVGHVTLNLILIPQFIEDGWEVHYIGDANGVEYEQITQLSEQVIFHAISTGKLRRYFSWQNFADIFKVILGIVQSAGILWGLRPQALFSKGGFVSVPPVIASRLLRIPVFIHESDLSMGLANKIAYRFATRFYTTFEPEVANEKTVHVGAVTKVGQSAPYQQLQVQSQLLNIKKQMTPQLPTLLFVGGSAGAKVFNDFVSQNLGLRTAYNIINITGDKKLDILKPRLYRTAYVNDLYQPLLELADVVITRGGSNTLFELLAMEKLHLIVPLGTTASRGDQLENAAYFVNKGYAEQLAEADLTLENLTDKINLLFSQADRYSSAMAQKNRNH